MTDEKLALTGTTLPPHPPPPPPPSKKKKKKKKKKIKVQLTLVISTSLISKWKSGPCLNMKI